MGRGAQAQDLQVLRGSLAGVLGLVGPLVHEGSWCLSRLGSFQHEESVLTTSSRGSSRPPRHEECRCY